MEKCGEKTEVYSRVTGYFRPVANWNLAKKEEFKDRKMFRVDGAEDTAPETASPPAAEAEPTSGETTEDTPDGRA